RSRLPHPFGQPLDGLLGHRDRGPAPGRRPRVHQLHDRRGERDDADRIHRLPDRGPRFGGEGQERGLRGTRPHLPRPEDPRSARRQRVQRGHPGTRRYPHGGAEEVGSSMPPLRNRIFGPAALSFPTWAYVVFFFVIPVAMVISFSFGYKPDIYTPVATDRLSFDRFPEAMNPA